MGRYTRYQRQPLVRKRMNPIWRGIGCLLMIIVPVLSYWIGYFLLQQAKNRNLVPPGLLGKIHFPEWVLHTPALLTIANFISSLHDVWAMLIFFFVILTILAGLVSLIYSLVYQSVGPSRYTDVDAPPEKRKPKVYTR